MTYDDYKQDMNANHHDWYCAIGDKAEIPVPADLLAKSRNSHDEHLNDVALRLWDSYHPMYKARIAWAKNALGYPHAASSLSDTVCVLKNLVIREIQRETA